MSLDIVNKIIDDIVAKGEASETEISQLITAAERSKKGKSDGVSNAEARAVADFFMRMKAGVSSKHVPAVRITEGAMTRLNAFFVTHYLPYGDNTRPMMDLVLHVLEQVNAPPKLEQRPRCGSLQPLRLDPQRVAYVDTVKKQFIVKDTSNAFFGPFGLLPNPTSPQ